jgi:hypothetical protein
MSFRTRPDASSRQPVRLIQILLVEDNPADVEQTRQALLEAKLANEVHVVEDGEAAINFVRRSGAYTDAPRPDLILLDLNLPKKDGREVLVEIKNDPGLTRIPVVVSPPPTPTRTSSAPTTTTSTPTSASRSASTTSSKWCAPSTTTGSGSSPSQTESQGPRNICHLAQLPSKLLISPLVASAKRSTRIGSLRSRAIVRGGCWSWRTTPLTPR